MTTDRPDSTESPFTIEPGHVQLEMDLATYARDDADGVRVTGWEAAPFNLRFGISKNFEAGIFVTPQVSVTAKSNGVSETFRGFGDVGLRAKYNFWGNDSGSDALGLIADLKLPTSRRELGNGKVEGALILPYARDLPGGWGFGAMTGVEARYTDNDEYRPVWINTATFAHDLTEKAGFFVELASTAGDGAHEATFNSGLTYRVHENFQLDMGVNVGITDAAADMLYFVGLARRF
jgi:hypothetical protein